LTVGGQGVIIVIAKTGGEDMVYTRNIMRISKSTVLVIPKEIAQEMGLIKGEVMVIKKIGERIQATRLRDYIRKGEVIEIEG